MKLDILAFAAHPDDIELACSGTLIKHIKNGSKVGIIDLTEGELGSRGSRELRYEEAANATKIIGNIVRENLNLGDGFFEVEEKSMMKVIEMIRKYQPDIILCNAISDRHPDHGRGSELVKRAAFLSGLLKIETSIDGKSQEKWRPKQVFHYIQDEYIEPDFVIDISDEMEGKMKSILAYSSQFFNPESKEPQTPISSQEFMDFLDGRARQFGRTIGAKHGEGFTSSNPVSVKSLNDIL
ncbi:bacillithiol biosynthesis deacetylase BshB1 [bacterium]|jgi:bacillithiol biosynthesis deacetylase BshB1|nr:bacillithiol biosynthesis deacetylase BshB1 [Flavobacteriales bacterium]MDA9303910.1 bacillithiol biosynthesis deacetylase BshB1 [bacterium]MDA9775858.1 bacillithiol biosynthesis deacetylase BshB1 [Flavobacteriales bacterium]MDB4052236.1 bacillithiol biosynthesis deacetylase BshB1 [Flavobacteriales bacterium]|tara:strand:- start:1174 stop:1890 length:717 start_codon:yes stop_codon:yes gene_type:complete